MQKELLEFVFGGDSSEKFIVSQDSTLADLHNNQSSSDKLPRNNGNNVIAVAYIPLGCY